MTIMPSSEQIFFIENKWWRPASGAHSGRCKVLKKLHRRIIELTEKKVNTEALLIVILMKCWVDWSNRPNKNWKTDCHSYKNIYCTVTIA